MWSTTNTSWLPGKLPNVVLNSLTILGSVERRRWALWSLVSNSWTLLRVRERRELFWPFFQLRSKMIDIRYQSEWDRHSLSQLVHLRLLQEIKIRLRRNISWALGNRMGVAKVVKALPNFLDQSAHPASPPIITSSCLLLLRIALSQIAPATWAPPP